MPGQTQFAFPLTNVFVTFSTRPSSGSTTGSDRSAEEFVSIPGEYLAATAWFFDVSTTVADSAGKWLCVVIEPGQLSSQPNISLLRLDNGSWKPLTSQEVQNGAFCGVTPSLGVFALAQKAPTATATSSRTATSTPSPTVTGTRTFTPTPTPTETPTRTPSSTPTASAISTDTPAVTGSPTASASSTTTPTSTATLAPGSYQTGTPLRSTTRVNFRSAPGTSATVIGVIDGGTTVTVTGPSVSDGGRVWVPVLASGLGSGWIAGTYLVETQSPTPTQTPRSATPGTAAPSRTPTRPAGGFITGDSVRTTASVNLRVAAGTSSSVLGVIAKGTYGTVTGAPVSSGGNLFYPVRFEGYAPGYMVSTYLQRVTTTPTPTRTPTPSPTVAGTLSRWTTDDVNMRSGPGTGYRVVTMLPKGSRVAITGAPRRSGGLDWYPVRVNGTGDGWIAGKFLSATPPL